MERKFMKGNEAIAEAAIRAGCRFFAGYPITPQNEIPEYMSRKLPEAGGVFVQGESEIASINMVYGAAATGTRSMTSSSSVGISLKAEGISYLAGARLPSVIVNVMRGGPGLGSIQPAQQDYLQATKAPGSGGFRTMVFAPSTIQEAVDLTYKAFDCADRSRTPVIILTDGCTGAIMEPVVLPEPKESISSEKDWVLDGCKDRDIRRVKSFASANPLDQEQENIKSSKLYERWQREDVQVEELMLEDAEIVITAYGITARIAKSALEELRKEGIKVGLIRPITVSPFPYDSFRKLDAKKVKAVLCAEMSIPGQMIEDVRLGIEGRIPVDFVGRSGGIVIPVEDIVQKVREIVAEGGKQYAESTC